jgi:hypothetical protein
MVEDNSNMGFLTKLPNELRENILEEVDPQDLLSLSLTCKEINQLISGNRKLYRALYLARLVSRLHLGHCWGNVADEMKG